MPQARKPWFAAKRYGYGSGLPISWEGWTVFIAYLVGMIVLPPLLPPFTGFCFIAVASAALLWVCATRTDGGWRWRNGED